MEKRDPEKSHSFGRLLEKEKYEKQKLLRPLPKTVAV